MSDTIPSGVAGSTVAITGGTGSFGRTMVKHLLGHDVGRINILSRDEAKQEDMRQEIDDSRVKFYLGDVRDRPSVDNALTGADFVFHAAALKQVPSCEFFPDQAVKTNVIGSQHVIDSAHAHGVRTVVCLSTDKAVYPMNAMGMSKALMEKTAQAFARNNPTSKTTVAVTRYGNVMFSRGSVIPLFVRQLRGSGVMTVTEPRMTRFLMSLQESVQLVEHAFLHAQPGDIYIKKARACTVGTLAKAVAEVLGQEPRIDIIGVHHGEQLAETLLTADERMKSVEQDQFFRVPLDSRSLDYTKYVDSGHDGLIEYDDYTSDNAERLDVGSTAALIGSVPEMQALLGAKPT